MVASAAAYGGVAGVSRARMLAMGTVAGAAVGAVLAALDTAGVGWAAYVVLGAACGGLAILAILAVGGIWLVRRSSQKAPNPYE